MSLLKPEDQAWAYWNSPLTKKEAQQVFDDYAKELIALKETLLKLDFAIGYLLEQGKVTPEQVKDFMDKKMLEFMKKTDEKVAEMKAGQLGREHV